MKYTTFSLKTMTGAALLSAALLCGCGNSNNDEFVFTDTNQNQAVPQNLPVASNDAFPALGNAILNQPAPGVLANDTVNGGSITGFDSVGSRGGAIDLNADGSFTYTPLEGVVGEESFTYTLANTNGEDTATVTLTSNASGRFVDNSATANGNGTQGFPFNNLQDAANAARSGDTIFVARGDGSSTGLSANVTLPEGVNLVGEGAGLILGQTIVPEGQQPVVNATIVVSGDNTISGIRFEGPATVDNPRGLSIRGDGASNITIRNNTFASDADDPSERQISLLEQTGTADISSNLFLLGQGTRGIECRTSGGSTSIFLNDNTIESIGTGGETAVGFTVEIQGEAIATVECSRNEVNGSESGRLIRGWLSFDLEDSSETTIIASQNRVSFLSNTCLSLDVEDQSMLTASFVGNKIDQSTNAQEPVISMDFGESSRSTVVFEDMNTITNAADTGIEIGQTGSSILNFAFRNNTVDTIDGSLFVDASDSATFCGEIVDNTFSRSISFDERTSGDFRIEQFGDAGGDLLEMINTFNGGEVNVDEGTVTSVPAGSCMIP